MKPIDFINLILTVVFIIGFKIIVIDGYRFYDKPKIQESNMTISLERNENV